MEWEFHHRWAAITKTLLGCAEVLEMRSESSEEVDPGEVLYFSHVIKALVTSLEDILIKHFEVMTKEEETDAKS